MPVNAPNYQFPEDIPHVSGDRGTGALAVRNDTDAVTTDADGDYTYIATDASGAVKVVPGSTPMDTRVLECEIDSITICPPATGVFDVNITETLSDIDTFGASIFTTRYNQVEIDFSGGLPGAAYISTTTSGGGTVTAANGSGVIQSGVGANGKALITSDPVSDYRPGFEMYFWGTASFTIPTDIDTFQRIGLYDDNNGYFIGYEGLVFGYTRRSGGIDTFTAISSWDDPLTGTANSKFTRGGVPEALDVTKFNIYRIRFGWFGSAPMVLELLSPDGDWVEALKQENPNNFTVPHIENPNLPVRIQVSKTSADGTNIIIKSGCAAAGATSDLEEIEKPIKGTSLAKLVKTVISAKTPSGNYVNVQANAQGKLQVAIDPLDCAIDSVTICPPATGVFNVDIINQVDVRPLDCDIDSITVCPPATGVFDVNVVNSQVITVIPGRRSLRGVYFAALGPITYTTAADAATGGDVWLVNTSASVVAYLKHLRFTVVLQDLALLPQLPTIRLERMTFTGTPSGTLITPAKRDSADLANTATVRTTSTGMVITAGAAIDSYSPAASDVVGGLLAANAAAAVPSEQVLDLTLDDYIVLRQNEGIVLRQHTAGAATENRFYWANFNWEEI